MFSLCTTNHTTKLVQSSVLTSPVRLFVGMSDRSRFGRSGRSCRSLLRTQRETATPHHHRTVEWLGSRRSYGETTDDRMDRPDGRDGGCSLPGCGLHPGNDGPAQYTQTGYFLWIFPTEAKKRILINSISTILRSEATSWIWPKFRLASSNASVLISEPMTQRPPSGGSLRGSTVTIRLIGLLTGSSPLMTRVSKYASSIQLIRETSENTLEATLSQRHWSWFQKLHGCCRRTWIAGGRTRQRCSPRGRATGSPPRASETWSRRLRKRPVLTRTWSTAPVVSWTTWRPMHSVTVLLTGWWTLRRLTRCMTCGIDCGTGVSKQPSKSTIISSEYK